MENFDLTNLEGYPLTDVNLDHVNISGEFCLDGSMYGNGWREAWGDGSMAGKGWGVGSMISCQGLS